MKKSYYNILFIFCLFAFSSVIKANDVDDKYTTHFKNRFTQISQVALRPIDVKSGTEQVVFIEVKGNGVLHKMDVEKPVTNEIFYKDIDFLVKLSAPYSKFLSTFDKDTKLSRLKITFIVNDRKMTTAKSIKLIELKNVMPDKI
ncbi:MAG: hypothetical protein OQK98_11545 [Gammaproteobacteria bacterium]|nr:hypothetical protein [Gammaproteobacteria bacterium]